MLPLASCVTVFLSEFLLRLVFASDGVVIKSVERYDLVENQTDGVWSRTVILLITPSLMMKWKQLCRNRKQKRNKPMTMFYSGSCDWLVPSPTTQFWIISNGVVNGIERNGNVLILPTPIPSSLWLRLRLWLQLSLMTPTTTATPTPSQVKTSL